MEIKKTIVLWCGAAPNQKALANKIFKEFGLAGIVVDKKHHKKSKKTPGIVKKIYNYLRFKKINEAWKKLQIFYRKTYPRWPNVPILEADTINCEEVKKFTEELSPHLVVVSGTSLIKQPLLDVAAEIGIINLHTGLSPYVKGGPNCTNWCIANNQWELVGNTIMWINAGIDSGNIIVNEPIDVRSFSNLSEVQINVMEHAHNLYLRAINYLLLNNPPYNSVPQKNFGHGNLFLTKMWTDKKKAQLLRNWKTRKADIINFLPKTVSLP